LGVLQIEVIDVDVTPLHVEPIDAVADDHLGAFACLEDDCHAVATVELLEKRLHPVLAAHASRRLDEGNACVSSSAFQPFVILAGDVLQVCSRDSSGLTVVPQEAVARRSNLQMLNDDVAEDTIETLIAKADGIGMMTVKQAVHGGPRSGFCRTTG